MGRKALNELAVLTGGRSEVAVGSSVRVGWGVAVGVSVCVGAGGGTVAVGVGVAGSSLHETWITASPAFS